jgi:hypothetical protein
MDVRVVPITSLARTVRSKNAKTHHITLEIIFDNRLTYERVVASGVITRELIAELYRIPLENITHFFFFDPGMGIKITMKRPLVSGNPGESDIYGCQQYAPLFQIKIPWPWEDGIIEEQ